MAKNKTLQHSKPKTSIFLCCFGSLPKKDSYMESSIKESDPIPKQKRTRWFTRRRIRIQKNSVSKTASFEASAVKVQYSKSRSKSNLSHKSQAPAIIPPPPTQPAPVHPGTPYYTPSQTMHGANSVEDTRQQGRASSTQAKQLERRVSSTIEPETTSKRNQNARSSYDPVVGMSVIVVTLVIMILWGRLCAILCTSAWLYFIPRFRRSETGNDEHGSSKKSNDTNMDSEMYKKKVIMEGLLERNHIHRSIL